MAASWDIFCRVVDNFGDVGVSWRLARQLAAEHDVPVRLWVDDMRPLSRLCADVDARAAEQTVRGVELRHWIEPWQPVDAAEVVIEAFGCELPATYIDAMAQRKKPSLWFNLEYLSAESWVDGCHALPSLQANGLDKFFFFPGFNARTGGLLREADLLERRRRLQQVPGARQAFLHRIGVTAAPEAQLISLFAYENAALASWLQVLSQGEQAVHLLVPQGRIVAELQSWLGEGELQIGVPRVRGALTVQLLPFLDQDD